MPSVSTMMGFVSAAASLAGGSSNEQTLLLSWINEGYRRAIRLSGCYVEPFSVTLTDGVDDYQIGTAPFNGTEVSRSMGFKELWANGTVVGEPVQLVDARKILERRRGAANQVSGTPREMAMLGLDRIMLWPTPGANTTLEGWSIRRPAALSSGDTPTAFGEEHHEATVQAWALKRAFEYRGDLGRAQAAEAEFNQGVADLTEQMQVFGGDRPAPVYDFRSRRRRYPDEI